MKELIINKIEIIEDNLILGYDYLFYGVIYKVTNKINGKIYIGKTKQLFKKYINTKFKDNYLKNNPLLYKAIKKYGIINFNVTIIDTAISLEELNMKEKKHIKDYNSINPDIGYNIKEGGDGGDYLHLHPNKKEICKKISDSNKGRTAWNKGKRAYHFVCKYCGIDVNTIYKNKKFCCSNHWYEYLRKFKKMKTKKTTNIIRSERTKKQISKTLKNHKVSLETRNKISNSLKERYEKISKNS